MELRPSILKTLAYFDVFHYPLTLEDIRYFLDTEASETAVRLETEALLREGRLYRTGPFYSLQNDPTLAARRLRCESHADKLLVIANRGGKLLYQFPYVRGVYISGSLSKRCADEKADIDYFIITRANRLWIARTMMHIFKKLTYLRGHQHRYCMNYYIDEEALEIKEKNLFTAIELLTLMPVCGNGSIAGFFQANDWTTGYLPHYRNRSLETAAVHRSSLLKRALERLLANRLGDALENYFRKLTDRRWKKKTERGDLNFHGDMLTLQCGKHYSRPDPAIFQQKVLARYHHRVKEVLEKYYGHPITSSETK
ncbi:hypothetical protein [Puia dinghuensis]|uniref:Nucleotidyltransferase n=1 Tax=Puia dinghuensis TaxID=1792502 RepID=A0A8J2UDB6_9BACT|nr:hypothetical protein [Puia dinghuensis]GGA99842.1 hypothetical protein GCM10011511_23940 [Puia dinghuensis]